MSKKVKIVLLLIMVAVVMAGFFLFYPKQPDRHTGPLEKLNIASPFQEASALVYLADKLGYFKKNGLDVDLKQYDSGFQAVRSVLSQEADIALATDYAFVISHFDNEGLRILSAIAEADVEEVIAYKDRGILKKEDLKGKKIGLKRNSSAEFHLFSFLLFAGLAQDEVEVIDLPPAELVESMIKKTVDAILVWPPHAYNVKRRLREKVISWSAQSGQHFYWLAVTTEKKANQKKPAYKKFLQCLVEAENFIQDNASQVKQDLKQYMGLDEDYMHYHWPRQRFALQLPQTLLIKLEDEARWAIRSGLTDKNEVPNYLDFIYMDALEQIKPGAVTIIR